MCIRDRLHAQRLAVLRPAGELVPGTQEVGVGEELERHARGVAGLLQVAQHAPLARLRHHDAIDAMAVDGAQLIV